MSSWNMPPGVNTNMIPGNRPEDIAEEEWWLAFEQKLDAEGIHAISDLPPSHSANSISLDDLWHQTEFVKMIQIARDMGYQHGYNEGQAEAEIALAMKHQETDEERIAKAQEATACEDPMTCVRCNWPLESCQHLGEIV